MPAFTVVIPTFNRASALTAVLGSVLAQTFEDFEVVVVDDGSSDDTRDVVTGSTDPRVRYVSQDNAGGCAARNAGAGHARGRFLTFLDDDDSVLPGWLAAFAEVLDSPECAVACCGALHVDLESGTTTVSVPKDMGPAFDSYRALLISGTFALRREAFDMAGGYTSGLPAGPHQELALRLLPLCTEQGWSVCCVDQPLVRVRRRQAELRWRNHPQALYTAARYVLDHHRQRLARSPVDLSKKCSIAAVSAARLGRYSEARRLFLDAVRADPRNSKNYGRLLLTFAPPAASRVWRSDAFRAATSDMF